MTSIVPQNISCSFKFLCYQSKVKILKTTSKIANRENSLFTWNGDIPFVIQQLFKQHTFFTMYGNILINFFIFTTVDKLQNNFYRRSSRSSKHASNHIESRSQNLARQNSPIVKDTATTENLSKKSRKKNNLIYMYLKLLVNKLMVSKLLN